MLSQNLIIAVLFCIIVLVYLGSQVDETWLQYIVIPVVLLVGIYIMRPVIDKHYAKRNTPDLESGLRFMLRKMFPYYSILTPEAQEKFRKQIVLFNADVEYKAMGWDKVPKDVQTMIAANAIQLTFDEVDAYLFPSIDFIAVYQHPFPSPKYPIFHVSELVAEEKLAIFSTEQLVAGSIKPHKYFNIALYEFAKAYRNDFSNMVPPDIQESDWPKLQTISAFSKHTIYRFIGIDAVDVIAVAIVCYFTFPEKFAKTWPEAFQQIKDYLNLRKLKIEKSNQKSQGRIP